MSGKPNPMNDYVAMYFLSIGIIEVDDEGQVWRLKDKRGGKSVIWRSIKPRIFNCRNKNGYLRAGLWLNGKQHGIFLHRIVWLSKKGIIPENFEINHKNGIKDDNRPENIELMTTSENMRHSFNVLYRASAKGEQIGSSKLTENDVINIRFMHKNTKRSYASIAKIYGVTKGNIAFIVRRESWAHVI